MSNEAVSTPVPSQDERIIAALGHATILLPFWGTIGAIVIWVTQKDKSPYVAFQSLQAVVYHLALVLGGFLAGACYFCSLFAFPILMMAATPAIDSGAEPSPALFLPMSLPFCVMGLGMLAWLAFIVYGLLAAAAALQGKDFRYVVIGNRLKAALDRS
jgi:uncharacterized Tic20 family protein